MRPQRRQGPGWSRDRHGPSPAANWGAGPGAFPGAFGLHHLVDGAGYDSWLYRDCAMSARPGRSWRRVISYRRGVEQLVL
ncbi:DUF6336 family protein [Streptomyces indiaensis]|uniref:DUF6336 family protein n=1 Tax=Streptomyces indiaensis TaxID=284033 RepID=UPI003556A1E3